MKKTFIGILLSLMLTFVSSQAMAAYATATATLDLTDLVSSGLILEGAAISASVTSSAVTILGVPVGDTVAATVPSIADASASRVGNIFTSTAKTYEVGYTFPSSTARSAITTLGGGEYIYTGSAMVNKEFNISYSALIDLSTMIGTNAQATGEYAVWFYITTVNGVDGFIHQSIPTGYTFYNEIPTTNFKFFLTLNPNEKVSLDYGTSATVNASAVPLPAAFWLLGSGVLGLIGIRRRNKI
jgi:hypothetical protein